MFSTRDRIVVFRGMWISSGVGTANADPDSNQPKNDLDDPGTRPEWSGLAIVHAAASLGVTDDESNWDERVR